MAHPDEAVKPEKEVKSAAIAEAQLRHEFADSDLATDQEKKQAEVEKAHALSTRPDGSYAQLHETAKPSLAVADEDVKSALKEQQDEAVKAATGEQDTAKDSAPQAGNVPEQKRQ